MRIRNSAALAVALVVGLTPVIGASQPSVVTPVPRSAFKPVPDRELVRVTPAPKVILDTFGLRPPPTHPVIVLVEPEPIAVPVEPKANEGGDGIGTTGSGGVQVTGTATWYCLPGRSVCPWMASSGNYAAAGPRLRAALGGGDHCKPGPHCWRNRIVTVSGRGHTERVKLIDWCACGGSHVIDLFAPVMAEFVGADKSGWPLRGGFPATITW